MKKQDDLSVGGALFLSVIFAIMAILSYNSDKSGNPIAIIPAIGVVVGLFGSPVKVCGLGIDLH